MIVIIGGTGLLGKELSKNKDTIPLNSNFDLYDFTKLEEFLNNNKPDIIINCAAIKSENVDYYPIDSINLNIIGSANISKYCIEKNIRLVYISTDYVYPGDNGNFKEDDNLNPQNNYAWTKLAGESSTKLVKNHLIIRTSFGDSIFPYKYAFKNLYTSKDYVDIISPMIFKASTSTFIGTINIGTEKKSIFEYAIRRNSVMSSNIPNDKDFSLNLQKYKKLYDK
jgi:dTDP-4-dehydrorhamnose reductase